MQSGLPADAASLRETGSVDRYTLRGPVSAAVQCLVSLILILSLMAPRVCTCYLLFLLQLVCGLSRLSRRVWRRFVRGSREISVASPYT